MDIPTLLVSVLVASALLLGAYMYFSRSVTGSSNVIQGSIQDGKKQIESTVPMPRSYDQPEGMTFSYTCWVKIDDFSYRYGEPKVIFVKGTPDLKTACPALLIDANTNSLLVKLDTFGTQETLSIPNIPAKKWMHIAIAVDQDSVDLYMNGTLFLHHTLSQLPKQNGMTLQTSVGGGFEGKLANLEYYNRFMTPSDVQKAMQSTPQPDPSDVAGPLPPYFDITWWTGRRG